MENNFRSFASDNNSGVHPQIMEALLKANSGHAIGYGDDDITRKAIQKIETHFGSSAQAFFVFNGTGANVTGLLAATHSFSAIICSETAHINVDECGAPEKFTTCKLLTVPTNDGKLTPSLIKKHLHGFGSEHHAQPRVISISQTTELGTLYKPNEIRDLASIAHENGMLLHMDGARLSNAAAALGLSFKEFTADCGVDFVSFGGTKNGLMYGEAVVFLNTSLAENFKFIRKQGMQLASKMRYISAQFLEFLSNDLYLQNANHANSMAKILEAKVKSIPEITITQPVEANGIFAIVPQRAIVELQKYYFFYVWDEDKSEVRWMTSFDTTLEDIDGFINQLKQALK
ncbi:threonine aldolase family protein [Williamwhitmania taraxaci]|uniref:L-threonine aldolase n=1 Tax=Williamwhitmania taraxaci TaxID=1640674 RepID=A0A1G6HJZ4_9BACT|nr:low specificity L-threonine aldolase [Williamwhitmania taraxaci]SDB94572.1 L-threonine aldolase [Williamwhitmania taraxaci]